MPRSPSLSAVTFRRFLLERLLWTIFVLTGITVFMFTLTHIVPADPARAAAGPEASSEHVENLRRQLGLDRPLHEQYLAYLEDLIRLDFGTSYRTQRPVREDLARFFPATLELTLFVMIFYVIISVGLGIVGAVNQGQPVDYLVRLLAAAGVGLPAFWFGMLLQLLFYQRLQWLPAAGRIDPAILPPARITGLYVLDSILTLDWAALSSSAAHLVLPVLAAVTARLGVGLKLTRTAVLEVLGQDFVRTARSKGLSHTVVILRHVLKNAAIPIVTTLGIQFGALLGGTVIVEVVFGWPGIGRYAVGAIDAFDFPAIMSVTVVIAVIFLLINLVVDVLYTWLDPRIKYT